MSGFSTARQKMVDGQVRTSDVTDSRILDAMLEVPREAFVPEGKQALTYLDLDLDVSAGGNPKRCLIKPVVTAKLMQAAEIKQGDKVLVVGAASGYAAALVAKLAGQVTATESDPAPGWCLCHLAAAAGYHRDPLPWRFRAPDPVRRRGSRPAWPGAAPRVRLLGRSPGLSAAIGR